MSESTRKRFAEQLHTNTHAEEKIENKEISSNENLKTFELIKNTPFYVSGDPETGYVGIMGRWKITDNFNTPEEVCIYVNAQPWELLITVMATILDVMQEMKGNMTINDLQIRK